MTKEEMAKQFANDISGLEAEKSQWHYVKDKDFPTEEGCYLVCRKHNEQRYLELLSFDGKYWVTGLHDDPEDFIIAWKSENLPEE